jgi:hypothetical protein
MLPHGRGQRPATTAAAPVVVSPSEETPAQAAIGILSAYPRFVRVGAEQAERELRQLATSEDADRLVAELRDDVARLQHGYPGGPTTFWIGALAIRETAIDRGRAHVEIWFTRVVAPPRLAPYAEWRLGRLDLALEGGTWRLSSFDDLPGPRPASLPGDDASGEILTTFARFDQVRP